MSRLLTVLLLLAALALADVVEQGPKDSAPSGLRAGVARVDITPPVGIAQMNWGSQTHVTAEGADPAKMLATALVLESGGEKFAMVDLDRLFVDGLEDAISRASQLTGIPAEHIRLGATHTHAGAIVNAEILGYQVAAVALQIETVRREPTFEGFIESTAYQAKQHWRVKGPRDVSMRFASTIVETPRRQYSEKEISDMRARVTRAQKQLAEAESSGDAWKVFQAGARVRRFADLLAKWTGPQGEGPVKVEIQALRIGELAIVAMPGEPFAEIGAEVRKRSPFAFTMFCGYSDGVGGNYMPTAEEYGHGGYEVERTPYGPGADRAVIEAAVRLLEALAPAP